MLSLELVLLLLVSSCTSVVSSSTIREYSGRVADNLKYIDTFKKTLKETACCDYGKVVKISAVDLDYEAKKPRKFKINNDKTERAERPGDLQGHHQTTRSREPRFSAEIHYEDVTSRDSAGVAFPVNNAPDPQNLEDSNLPKIRKTRGWIFDQYLEEERQREQEMRKQIIADYEREKAMKREEIYQELRIWGPISAVILILVIALCVICCMYRPCQKNELRRGRYMSASQL